MAAECPNCGAVYRYAESVSGCQKLVDGGGYCIRCDERIDLVADIVDPGRTVRREEPRRRSIDLRSGPDDSNQTPSPPWAFA